MTQQAVQKDLETRMQAAVDVLTREFASVRTGRANAALMDGVRVEAYGNMTPLNQVASVSVPDPRTILIQPWDATQLKKISEDEERRGHDQIQKTTDRFTAKIDELTKKKEQEVLTV